MRRLLYSIIPDEWKSGWTAYGEMLSVILSTRRAVAKICVSVILPFAGGMLVFCLIKSRLTADFMQAYLVVLGVLFGFVSTIMLFIGSTEGTDVLNHDEASRYAKMIRYLLASQAISLCCYLAAIVIGAWWLFSKDSGPSATAFAYLEPLVFGSGGLALARTILLPAQIYDRHDFVMTELVTKKKNEHQKQIEAMRHELEQT
jgi:formate hydrogenlyase subunit 3/multisubunit Na+/H+ antiporter MnhD subunit